MPYKIFDAFADEYDAWYDTEPGATIFSMEVDCLRPLLHRYDRPYLEIGVGSGRFAKALGIEYGVDPARTLLLKAESRGIRTKEASGERLPFAEGTFGGVLIAFTLCFVDDPLSVLKEAWRVLKDGGGVVLGLILKESPCGKFYARKGKEGHPIYKEARFYTKRDVETLLRGAGFAIVDFRSVLFQSPGQNGYHPEKPLNCYRKTAGFVAAGSIKHII